MYRSLITFLGWLLFAAHANAMAYNWGLPGTRTGDIQNITITEFAPSGRVVTLIKPEEVTGFARQFDRFSLYNPKKWGDDFYKVFPVRYQIAVHRGTLTNDYLLVATPIRSVPKIKQYGETIIKSDSKKEGIRFELWVPEHDGSFTQYSEEPGHWFNDGTTPLEQCLAHLFPEV